MHAGHISEPALGHQTTSKSAHLEHDAANAGNGNATIDNSTVFLDFLGPLGGASVATWTNTSANAAVQSAMQSVQDAVRRGFMARVAADWQVS